MKGLIFKLLEKVEDRWLAKQAKRTLKKIESGKEKTSPWSQAKKRIHKN